MKIMVVATEWWHLPGNISIALAKEKFQIALVSPPRSVVRKIASVKIHFPYQPWIGSTSIAHAIRVWAPDFLIPTDDQAVSELHRIHEHAVATGERGENIRCLIEKSLGAPESFAYARAKSKFMELAASIAGVRCPKTVIVPSERALDQELAGMNYPLVIKADGSFGGRGVRVVESKEAAHDAFRNLSMPFPSAGAIVQSIDGLTFRPILERLLGRHRIVTLQQYVKGHCANSAVICANGKVLQGISAEAVEVFDVTGPSSVIRIIDNVEMRDMAATLVSALKLSGFIGFDFIIDSSNHAWLIEMNPRVTPISHLVPADGINLTSIFSSYATGVPPKAVPRSRRHKIVALFPQELQRSTSSDHLSTDYHDIPWTELEYVRSCLVADSGNSLVARIRNRFGLNFASLLRRFKSLSAWKASAVASTAHPRKIWTRRLFIK